MPSSKGKPTDPKLREEIKEKVKNDTNKDGSGKGQWAAWKASKLSKEYEEEGGSYENEPGSKNEPQPGPPEQKSDETKEKEVKSDETEDKEPGQATTKTEAKGKPKANSGKKASGKAETKTKAPPKEKKPKKVPTEGIRKSSRITSTKRTAPEDEKDGEEEEDEEEEEKEVKKAPKKRKVTKK